MKWAAFLALMSHWRSNPWQLLTLVLGLALATGLWSGVQAINTEARASYAAAATTLEQAAVARITAPQRNVSLEEYVALRRAGWQVSPVLEGILPDGPRLIGIEPLTFPRGPRAPQIVSDGPTDFLTPDGVIFAHPDDVSSLQSLGITIREDPSQRSGRALTDIATAGRMLGNPDFSALLVAPETSLRQRPLEEVTPDLRISAVDQSNDVSRLTGSFHLNLTAFGLLSFAVGIFIVYGAIGLAFEQRRPVFRTLRALGLPLRLLMALLACELGVLALISGALGVVLGYGVAAALLPDVAATLRGLYGADIAGTLAIRPEWWVSGLAMALGGTAAAAVGAFVKLARIPITASANPRAMAMQSGRAISIMFLCATGLLLAGGAIALLGEGLMAGFALLACLLTGAALMLPAVLSGALAIAARLSRRAVAQWFWADTRQQLPGLSMALMALLLAMAANIGVSTMVSSFRLTFTGYLDQRLSSELYLRFDSAEQAEDVVGYVTPKVDAVLPIVSAPLRVGGLPAEVFGVIDHRTYRDFWPMLDAMPNHWDRLAAGEGVLINEQLSRRQDIALGDELEGDTVLGIYSDYGNAAGQIILDLNTFQSRYPDAVALRFGLRSDTPDQIAQDLQTRFDLSTEQLIDQQGIKTFSLSVFERTFAVTTALNILTLSVAGLAILISLLTLATMRLPQLAPVWALGLTRQRLARLELVRALVLAAFTGVAAIPLGLGLAWVLLAIVNVEAFGWRLPMYLFPLDYLKLGVLTLLAAVLAALWPAIRLAQTPPTQLLKVFSGER